MNSSLRSAWKLLVTRLWLEPVKGKSELLEELGISAGKASFYATDLDDRTALSPSASAVHTPAALD